MMNNGEIWQAALGELEVSLSRANFTTWFRDTAILEIKDGYVVVAVPNAFTKNWLANKYHKQISAVLRKFVDNLRGVDYIIRDTEKKKATIEVFTRPEVWQPKEKVGNEKDKLNPGYTFENFVVGPSNRLAHAACAAVAQSPGQTYNPLFIYGGVGLGKTHLMQAIGNRVLGTNKKTKVLYTPCEKFTNEFIHSISTNKVNDFKKTYREVDVLLIDDVQFLGGKEQTQEEFFHTFNTLHLANKQIVLTSDRPPKAIAALEARLVSRFEWGMIADISPPDLETRVAILQSRCASKNYEVSDEVINFLARSVQRNIRELEGALNRVVAYCELNNCEPSTELAKELIGEALVGGRRAIFSPKDILEKVAGFYNISLDLMLGPRRNRELVVPRQIGAFLLREELNMSYPQIGGELGGRDHTTIMHACQKIIRETAKNQSLKQEISMIREKLYSLL